MYSYSHLHNSGWMGKYDTPAEALAAGRAAYGGDTRIFVGQLSEAMYSDMFIGARALLSYMRENAADKVGDDNSDAFDSLSDDHIQGLDDFLVTAIGEWETELPEAQQFTGIYVSKVRGFSDGEEVRRAHF